MRQSLARLQHALAEKNLDGVFIAAPEQSSSTNVRYLSGFTGSSAYLLITPADAWLLTDFRYVEQARIEAPEYAVVRHSRVGETLADLIKAHKIWRLGFESDKVSVRLFESWQDVVPVIWRPLDRLIERLRLIKSADEIVLLRQAAKIAGESLMVVLATLEGRSEIDVAWHLEQEMRQRGADSLGFSTIVASGPRGALPHGHPTERIISSGDLVTIDFGAQYQGYKSDETVTVAVGSISPEQRRLWDLVALAQQAGIAAVRPGATSGDVDLAARSIIEDAGYGDQFGHGTGHGVGLDVHEDPYASPNPALKTVLEPGMTLTVEPGIYVPGLGGVRLEDTLVVTENGHERLTMVSKHFRDITKKG